MAEEPKPIEILGIVIQPNTVGFAWEEKVSFALPPTYCKYLGIKPKDTVYVLVRAINNIKTIFVNKERDGDIGKRCNVSDAYKISFKNFLLGITSKDFYEVSIVKYNNSRLSIRLKEIETLPDYVVYDKKSNKSILK